jgi:hypothetical protein
MKANGNEVSKKHQKFLDKFSILLLALCACCGLASSQKWTQLTTQFPVGVVLQLTDGTIMVQENKTTNWWRLRPNNVGVYSAGMWSAMPSNPAGYAPLYFASATLPDGRVIIEGGEFNNLGTGDTTLGAIYSPFTNKWTPVNPPAGWSRIGDAASVVLPNGKFMLANCCDIPAQAALLNASTLTWQVLDNVTGFVGKNDSNNEEGWNLLPNGDVLAIDTYVGVPGEGHGGSESEIYNPATGVWKDAGSTIVQLWDSKLGCGSTGSTHEIGPAVLRPNGTVFATGSNTCPGSAGHTAIYDVATATWTAGPDVPGVNDVADGPASILPDGNVLVDTNPGYGKNPSTLYEFPLDDSGWINIPQPAGLNPSNTEGGRMLVLPSGNVLLSHVDSFNLWIYQPKGTYRNAWRPTICPGCFPAVCHVGHTYKVSGTQFNGLSQGAAFGDDAQSATNFPLVQIRNNATGHRFFARTHSFSTMAVATGSKVTSTEFDILPTSAGTEFGDSTMVVIANGIPSEPVGIIVED